jgi:CubicO group peptidase (beta-lactamase class C family)
MNENSNFLHKLYVLSQLLIMKNRYLFLIFQFFVLRGFSQSPEMRIDSLMKWYYQPSIPGAVIAIQQHHKTIFKSGYGVTDLISRKPITADDNFNIGSLTKQFTAFAVLDLYYKGKFSLADKIGKYLKLPAPLASIRISQLLSHSSGIPDHYSFTDTFRIKHATDKDVLLAIRQADSLYFPSGTHYRYSNTAYCLLGLLIEKLSGLSYAEFLQQEVFGPLGIHDARVFRFNQAIPNRVTGYDHEKDGKFIRSDADESIFFSTEADGGIYISVNDYLKWCEAVESGEFSGTPMIRKAWLEHTIIDTLQSLGYGYGWFIHHPAGSLRTVYHTGSNGGFRSVVFLIPSLDYCVCIFSNRSDIDLEDIVSRVNHILSIPDNSFIKSAPLESFNHSWPKFAPCKETSSFSTLSIKNLNAKDMVLN